MTIDTLLPLDEVGRKLGGINEKTVRRMSQRGELPRIVKVGRRPVLPASGVAEYVERLKELSLQHGK